MLISEHSYSKYLLKDIVFFLSINVSIALLVGNTYYSFEDLVQGSSVATVYSARTDTASGS